MQITTKIIGNQMNIRENILTKEGLGSSGWGNICLTFIWSLHTQHHTTHTHTHPHTYTHT